MLTEVEGYEVLCHCGIQTPAYTVVTSGSSAAEFASKLLSRGVRSVVAKVVSPDVSLNYSIVCRFSTKPMSEAFHYT